MKAKLGRLMAIGKKVHEIVLLFDHNLILYDSARTSDFGFPLSYLERLAKAALALEDSVERQILLDDYRGTVTAQPICCPHNGLYAVGVYAGFVTMREPCQLMMF